MDKLLDSYISTQVKAKEPKKGFYIKITGKDECRNYIKYHDKFVIFKNEKLAKAWFDRTVHEIRRKYEGPVDLPYEERKKK